MEFELLYRKQFNRAALAEYLEVTEKTIIRWEKTNKPPKAVILLLQLLNNDLSHLAKEWEGFYFHNKRLYTPENEPVQAGHIRAIKYNRMTIDFLKRERSKAVDHVGNEKLRSYALNK
jgi:transcriptional regulator with XRE-family HTH domain